MTEKTATGPESSGKKEVKKTLIEEAQQRAEKFKSEFEKGSQAIKEEGVQALNAMKRSLLGIENSITPNTPETVQVNTSAESLGTQALNPEVSRILESSNSSSFSNIPTGIEPHPAGEENVIIPDFHTVLAGETLDEIVNKYKINRSFLVEINEINGPLKEGQKIFLNKWHEIKETPALQPTETIPSSYGNTPIEINAPSGIPETVRPSTLVEKAETERIGVYKVQSGDNMSKIAQKLSVKLPELLEENGLNMNSLIDVGREIKIPEQKIHTVRAGDTLYKISQQHDVPLNEVLSANGLNRSSIIIPEQTIIIPKKREIIVTGETEVMSASSGLGENGETFLNNWDKELALNIINANIQTKFSDSKITGEMIAQTAEKFSVNPFLLAAILRNDSSYGTRGKGATNNNPGNVGQTDELDKKKITVKGYDTLQEGIDAVGNNLRKRILAYKSICGEHMTPSPYEIATGIVDCGPRKGTKYWGVYMTLLQGQRTFEKLAYEMQSQYEISIANEIEKNGGIGPASQKLTSSYQDQSIGKCLATVQLTYEKMMGEKLPPLGNKIRNTNKSNKSGNFARDFGALIWGENNLGGRIQSKIFPSTCVITNIRTEGAESQHSAAKEIENSVGSLKGDIGIISFTDNGSPWEPGHIAMMCRERGSWFVVDTDIKKFNDESRRVIPLREYVEWVTRNPSLYHVQSVATLNTP